jgi:hypothetical protein
MEKTPRRLPDAQHHKPGHAAARQHHADAEQQAADDGARQALRGGEKAGFRDIDLVGPKQAIEPPGLRRQNRPPRWQAA